LASIFALGLRGAATRLPLHRARVDGLVPTSHESPASGRGAGHLSGNDRAARCPTGKKPAPRSCILAQPRRTRLLPSLALGELRQWRLRASPRSREAAYSFLRRLVARSCSSANRGHSRAMSSRVFRASGRDHLRKLETILRELPVLVSPGRHSVVPSFG
jgi:hypothetical protein